MSTPTITPSEEKAFDPKQFLAERNATAAKASERPLVPGKPASAEDQKPEAKSEAAEPPRQEHRANRSERRREHRLLTELGETRGKLAAMESFIKNLQQPTTAAVPKVDPLDRKNFANEADYIKAIAREAAKEETGKAVGENQFIDQVSQQRQAADAAFEEQVKLIPDWDKVLDEGQDLEFKDQPFFAYLFVTSELRAHVMEYLVEHPKEFQRIMDAKAADGSPDQVAQGRLFSRIEGKVENVYAERVKAAQAANKAKTPEKDEPTSKDRTHPAEEKSGRTGQSNGTKAAPLPKPSSEVAARGGSAPSISEPPVGSKEWMRKRNEEFATRRY
jgi:hypothetical protein